MNNPKNSHLCTAREVVKPGKIKGMEVIQLQFRPLSESNKYYLPKETFLTVIHYCRQYPQWCAELDALLDGNRAIQYDKDSVQNSINPDPVFDAVVRRERIIQKKDLVDQVATKVTALHGDNMRRFLILGVCYGFTFNQLQQLGIPCGKDFYYALRRRFYYELADKMP